MSVSMTVVFDFCCPYCYVMWAYFQKIRLQIPVSDTWIGWEIHPEVPAEGTPIEQILPAAHLESSQKEVAALGAAVGLTFAAKRLAPNTGLAFQGLEFARRQQKQHAWLDAVFTAFFQQQRNISDLDVLTDLAGQIGLDDNSFRAQVSDGCYLDVLEQYNAQWEQLGLQWVPTLFHGKDKVLEGSIAFDVFEQTIAALVKK